MRWSRLSRREVLSLGGGALLAGVLGCGDRGGTVEQPVGSVARIPPSGPLEEIRIGVVLPSASGAGEDVPLLAAVEESARNGVEMALDELAFNAELLDAELIVVTASAHDGASAVREAERLIDEQGVFAIVGGLGYDHASALARLSGERGVPFLNVGSPADRFRGEDCGRFTFHVEPSEAMYLDALAGWFVRSGFRRWFFVCDAGPVGDTLHARASRALSERHFGAREVGVATVAPSDDLRAIPQAIARAGADVVMLLTDAAGQLELVEEIAAQSPGLAVTGVPDPLTQTRVFNSRWATAAGAPSYRASAWESSLDAYGARELNARYQARFESPMDAPAWATYQGIKILVESAMATGSVHPEAIVHHLEDGNTVFDIWKGIGTSFRPWDHQLRQSLYLVELEAGVGAVESRLVGELPAIYMPGTDPIERLDQIGDLGRVSSCRF